MNFPPGNSAVDSNKRGPSDTLPPAQAGSPAPPCALPARQASHAETTVASQHDGTAAQGHAFAPALVAGAFCSRASGSRSHKCPLRVTETAPWHQRRGVLSGAARLRPRTEKWQIQVADNDELGLPGQGARGQGTRCQPGAAWLAASGQELHAPGKEGKEEHAAASRGPLPQPTA